jgi:hypothetical protein
VKPTKRKGKYLGGPGGKARAKKLTEEQRKSIAKKAAKARWEGGRADADFWNTLNSRRR